MNEKKARTQVNLHADLTVGSALAEILRHNFYDLTQWEGAARSWDDTEGVHQMRVTSRRLRAALAAFRSAVPKEASAHWSQELGWLTGQLGGARDLDVFIEEGLASMRNRLPLPGEDKVMAIAERYRAQSYETVRAMLDSDRYARFRHDFPDWAEKPTWGLAHLTVKQRKHLDMAITTYSRRLLDRLERQVMEAGCDVDQHNPEQMHRLRIECKKLRYAAEFFSPITPGLDAFIGQMKGLQDLLGVLNDVSVMNGLLKALLAGQSDPDVFSYSGGLVGWRMRQSYELLDGFRERWDAFACAKHPWWKDHGHHQK